MPAGRLTPSPLRWTKNFIFGGYLGEHLLPYRAKEPGIVILPLKNGELLSTEDASREVGLSDWWSEAESLWEENKKEGTIYSLSERIDFHNQLTAQLGKPGGYLVMYPKSGNNIAAAWVPVDGSLVDHKAYWMHTGSLAEARYLTGIFNSETLAERVRPLQAVGLFGARDFDKYVFAIEYGLYDDTDANHQELVRLVEHAEMVAAKVDLDGAKTFQAERKRIREAMDKDGVAADIESVVMRILPEFSLDDDEADESSPDPDSSLF